MTLSARVPGLVAGMLPGYVDDMLGANGLTRADVDFWAIHPGGRQIVDKAKTVLGLSASDVADSYDILRQYGNMSSPTILFILKRLLERRKESLSQGRREPKTALAMAFGPGLAIEGCLLRADPTPSRLPTLPRLDSLEAHRSTPPDAGRG